MKLQQLFGQCKRGDSEAQEAFYRMFVRQMFYLCQFYVSDDGDARELVSKSFVKTLLAIPGMVYISEESTLAWIRKIVVNECLMHIRYMRVVQHMPVEEIPDQPIPDEVFSGIGEKEILGYIRELSLPYRIVFNLYVFEKMHHKEIAALLKINEATSRSQLRRAREILMNTILKNHTEYAYRKR